MTKQLHQCGQPDYFEEIRAKAQHRWEQLESDPELAGPWHQLFKQVQSPKHVVSELLQNADDAGATKATIQIRNGEFVFSHNGKDFQKDEFASLCRFGYSNKRSLHTIGFRGIGFKSTFSLGDEVQLRTPTLAVAFFRERFTEPVWINGAHADLTEISVVIKDEHRQKEIEKNLNEWLSSPASLLFFDSVRSLHVGENEVTWNVAGSGPVPGSKWMTSSHEPDKRYLVIRSQDKPFPPEAVEEIRQERMISDDESEFPPSRVDVVLGMEGRLFVVLPTGVKTKLPFACNAPFIQDPARVKIKDPEISPANRWLLARIGKLAAAAMKAWLRRDDLPPAIRCEAYSLLPDVDRDDNSISGMAGTIAEESFEKSIEDREILLTEEETLVGSNQCVASPRRLLSIWSTEQVSALFDKESRPILSHEIAKDHRAKLGRWNLVEEITKSHVLFVLGKRHLPRPKSWRQLFFLWSYVSEDVCKTNYFGTDHKDVRIFPVQGRDTLYPATEVVRLGEKRLLQSDDDWQFLSTFLLVVNQNWPRFLAEQKRKADEEKNESLQQEWLAAHKILNALGLDNASDSSRVVELVAAKAFANEDYPLEDCIRIAQIAAKLGATVTNDFQFVTQDGYRKSVGDVIVADINGHFDQFVTADWYDEHVLHDDYALDFRSCSRSDWEQWVVSEKSTLHLFVPLSDVERKIWQRGEVERFLHERGVQQPPRYEYVTHSFVVKDWDFDAEHWQHWESQAIGDDHFWTKLVSQILQLPKKFYAKRESAEVDQVATTGRHRSITGSDVPAGWIMKLREIPCLLDSHGQPRKPSELLRRTPETEPLRDVELFVRAEDDNEHTRRLLQLLGVGDQPTGPDRLLDRLRSLAGINDAPISEIQKWYGRLDQIYNNCSTIEQFTIKKAFSSQRLILTDGSDWVTTSAVFLNTGDDDVPGVPLVHPLVRQLSLWQKIGVKERPTVDLVIQWLLEIPTGKKLDADEAKRVRALLPRYPERVWNECEHWLNLNGEWVNVSALDHSLAMQSLVTYLHLFDSIKQKTADFRGLDAATCSESPFADLPPLAHRIEDRFNESLFDLSPPEQKEWMVALGKGLARICLDSAEDQQSARELGVRLFHSRWQIVNGLETVPYIDGRPAGTPRQTPCLWKHDVLYVEDRPIAQLFKAVTQELTRAFNRNDLGEAIRACVDRSEEFISQYLAENFELGPMEILEDVELSEPSDSQSSAPASETESDEMPTDESDDQISSDLNDGAEAETDDQGDEQVGEAPSSDPLENENDRENDFDEVDDQPVEKPEKQPPRPSRPPLIETMAIAAGFSKDGDGRYYHDDGSWIQRSENRVFPWERYSPDGVLVQSYWTKDTCLHREPLEIDAARWNLCEKYPNRYSIVLRSVDETPRIYPGEELVRLRAEGRLSLHPANYRAVYNESN